MQPWDHLVHHDCTRCRHVLLHRLPWKSLDRNLYCRLLDAPLHKPVVIGGQHLVVTSPRREDQELEPGKDESKSTGCQNQRLVCPVTPMIEMLILDEEEEAW
jgi:hypothetical protein